MISLKAKIAISTAATAAVVLVAVALLWWYQAALFGDSLVRYVPTETVVYTHLNTHHKPSDSLGPYFGRLDRFFSFQPGAFEAKVLPYVNESAYFTFIDSVSKEEVSAVILKAKNDPDSQAKVLAVAEKSPLKSKSLGKDTLVLSAQEDYLAKIGWRHNRTLGLRLKRITNDHYLTFFVHRNWITDTLGSSFDLLPQGMAEIFNSYMSRWQPFLYGAVGEQGGKTIFALSDFSAEDYRAHAQVFPASLGESFTAYYEAEDLHRALLEFNIEMPEFAAGNRSAGVLVKEDEEGLRSFVFSLNLRARSDEELKGVLAELLGHFIPARKAFYLPDGTRAVETVPDPDAFSFKYIEDSQGSIIWQLMVDEEPVEHYVEKISLEDGAAQVYIARSLGDIALAKRAFRDRQQAPLPSHCTFSGAAEFFQLKKEALPELLWPFVPEGEYLLARTSTEGFDLKGCEL